ncbi:MAG: LysE family transporter [Chitinophagaceae bacterium]|nr:LysE family transporter [Chitinophagaceae bacterium]
MSTTKKRPAGIVFGRIALTGLFISFLGTLPLGTLNVAAMQISVSDGVVPAIYFVLGAMVVEIIYVRVSLVAMAWVRKHERLFTWLEWISLAMIVALAVTTFLAASNAGGSGKNIILSNTMHRFWLGVSMSAINPVQIPFWFGWSTVLVTKQVLLPRNSYYNFYIIGIGIGTLTGNAVFIFGGRLIVEQLNANQNVLNWIIGSVFTVTAIIMFIKMIRRKKQPQIIVSPKSEKTVEEINRLH